MYADKKGRPRVITARTAGFCFGVKRAVDAVYNEAGNGSPIYTYGPIIHNEVVVEDLRRRGVDVIHTPEELEGHKDATIVIRSHGVTKELQQKIETSCAQCIDTTCTFVKRIHEIVEKESAAGKKIIIIGNHGHAEAEGHVGWSGTPATIIENEREAECFDGDKSIPLCVVAQTTFNGNKFSELVDILKQRQYNVTVNNTICNATRERQTEAGEIASKADIMIVIGGKSSSNTAKLYEICKEVCDRTYLIQTAEDLDLHLNGSEKLIGITAGASTPNNIIEEVQKDVRRTDF
ncbi:MAG: 4-hydroxy-3-methylbut-2-enyl diphosphate reductase [Firmicutes bacterium]|nr:4-hydroxy-3-methylbut-2-enyl diphosphate reductase [Bacillota bacterium]